MYSTDLLHISSSAAITAKTGFLVPTEKERDGMEEKCLAPSPSSHANRALRSSSFISDFKSEEKKNSISKQADLQPAGVTKHAAGRYFCGSS